MTDNKKIKKQKHQGLQLKHVLELFNVDIPKVANDLNFKHEDILAFFSSPVLSNEVLEKFASYLNVPRHVITNFKDELSFSTTVLSENNTIINYNYCINQNSIENIAKIYEVVRELVKKENNQPKD